MARPSAGDARATSACSSFRNIYVQPVAWSCSPNTPGGDSLRDAVAKRYGGGRRWCGSGSRAGSRWRFLGAGCGVAALGEEEDGDRSERKSELTGDCGN